MGPHRSVRFRMNRRSTAEEKSRIKAMKARAAKGLLSEQELQALQEAEQQQKKDDCIIM
ncbi:hypothetical protein FRC17_005004 [Serendipita sp. 399]|nr:hypothetical protein FRC17_005004 [Serendipita sp. 399]